MKTWIQRSCAVVATALVVAVAGPLGCEAPKPPEAPGAPPAPGNCCMRGEDAASSPCGPQKGCCRTEADEDACVAKKGLWFHTPEGCLGAC